MKTFKLEVIGFDDAEQRAALYRLAKDCQQIVNRIWQVWEAWHVRTDSRTKIIASLNADAEWKSAHIGERPKWQIECFPKIEGQKNKKGNPMTLRNLIEADLAEKFPHIHKRVMTLLANDTCKTIGATKAARGSLAGWTAILLNRQSRPSATRPIPIPFDRANSKVVASDHDHVLYVRLDRHGDRTVSEFQPFKLHTHGQKCAKYIRPLLRIEGGEWEFKGSSLYYDSRKKKWFALVVCDAGAAEKAIVKPGTVALLRCGREHPIQLRAAGRRRFLRGFGRGEVVASIRRQLLTQRWNRQANYQLAGSANKGHGRERALGPVYLLSRRWKDFTKRYNHTLTTAVVNLCVAEGIETLVYVPPRGERFLSVAGKVPNREDSTGWDFFQIGSFLAYRCERAGIKFVKPAPDRTRKPVKRSARNGA